MPELAPPTSAALDPWMTVVEIDEVRNRRTTTLFGYAVAHHRTGGLAWLTTGPVVKVEGERAVTASGTVYALGRRLSSPEEIGDAEGRAAFRAFVLREADEAERAWLHACKIARHLGLPLPRPEEAAPFLDDHRAEYAALVLRTAPPGRA
jgi:hypothetical protein